MSRRRSFHRISPSAIVWRFLSQFRLCVVVATLSLAHFTCAIHAQTLPAASNSAKQPQGNEVPATPSPPVVDQAIPLPQIADRAEELDRLLREINNQLIPKSELLASAAKAEEQTAEIRRRALQTRDLLAGEPTTLDLEDEQRYWRSRSLEYAEERKLLTLRAAKLEEQIQTLEAQQQEWVATWIQIHESPGIEAIVDRIKQQLDKIQAARSEAQEQLNAVLTMQNQVSQQDQQISDILLRVRQARERERGHLLEMDGRPLWEARDSQAIEQDIGPSFHRSFDRSFTSAKEFVGMHKLPRLVSRWFTSWRSSVCLKLRRYNAARGRSFSRNPAGIGPPVFSSTFRNAFGNTDRDGTIYCFNAHRHRIRLLLALRSSRVATVLIPLTESKLRIFLYSWRHSTHSVPCYLAHSASLIFQTRDLRSASSCGFGQFCLASA